MKRRQIVKKQLVKNTKYVNSPKTNLSKIKLVKCSIGQMISLHKGALPLDPRTFGELVNFVKK